MSNFSQACRQCGTQISFDNLDDVIECPTCGAKNLPHSHHTQASIEEALGVEDAQLYSRPGEEITGEDGTTITVHENGED